MVVSEVAYDVVQAICRRSRLFADNLGLVLTAEDLEYIYEEIGKKYILEKIFPPESRLAVKQRIKEKTEEPDIPRGT